MLFSLPNLIDTTRKHIPIQIDSRKDKPWPCIYMGPRLPRCVSRLSQWHMVFTSGLTWDILKEPHIRGRSGVVKPILLSCHCDLHRGRRFIDRRMTFSCIEKFLPHQGYFLSRKLTYLTTIVLSIPEYCLMQDVSIRNGWYLKWKPALLLSMRLMLNSDIKHDS